LRIALDSISQYSIIRSLLYVENENLYIVGGCVRDLLLNVPLTDLDVVLERKSLSIINNLEQIFGVTKKTLSQFLTFKLKSPKIVIDVAQARSERYEHPGALPEVTPCYDIVKDLKRRDFTINSMAIQLYPRTFYLMDPLGGFEDLKKRILRVNKQGSFMDDPTRAFRAIKYTYRFNLYLDASTEREFENAKKSLPMVSFPRIKREVELYAAEERRLLMFAELGKRNILFHWNNMFDTFDYDLLVEMDRILPRKQSVWCLFLIPFGLEHYFIHNKDKFTVSERRTLEKIFGHGTPEITVGALHKIFKDEAPEGVRAWGLLNGVDERIIDKYITERGKLNPSISIQYIIERVKDPKLSREFYEKIEEALLEGIIRPGEEKEFLEKLLTRLC